MEKTMSQIIIISVLSLILSETVRNFAYHNWSAFVLCGSIALVSYIAAGRNS